MKAFDKIRLKHVLNILQDLGVPSGMLSLIQDIYTHNYARIKIERKLEGKIPVNQGIRQGDSLSPLLFNIVMNEIIKNLRDLQGYPLGDENVNIICYADDTTLIADNLHVCTVHQLYQSTFLLIQLKHTIIKSQEC